MPLLQDLRQHCSMLLLKKVAFTEVYYSLLARLLQMKIYFDMEQWQALTYTLETFRIHLLRNKHLAEGRRRSGLNLLRYTRRLMRFLEEREHFREREFRQKIKKLKIQIEKEALVLNKSWLLDRIGQILPEREN